MNWFDILILVVLGIGVFSGVRRGFVRQFFGLLGLIAAFLIGYYNMDRAGAWFESQAGLSVEYAAIAGFAAIFLIVQLCAIILSHVFDRVVRNIFLIGTVNRLFGAALGLITAGLIGSLVLYFLAAVMNIPSDELRSSSVLYEVVYQFFPQVWDLATQRFPQLTALSEQFPNWF